MVGGTIHPQSNMIFFILGLITISLETFKYDFIFYSSTKPERSGGLSPTTLKSVWDIAPQVAASGQVGLFIAQQTTIFSSMLSAMPFWPHPHPGPLSKFICYTIGLVRPLTNQSHKERVTFHLTSLKQLLGTGSDPGLGWDFSKLANEY